ncbi:uncharacterized protein LOC124379180 isoform X2 [Silurus meridionalis]|uniref:uncharacterized protein LOC124379180 isoform X2 n=1 Tax=Silurus meridionalis TaxID=175797 RepID=UPI001EEA5C9E|nr:uncharacterized protein LOC124379180 isoform X2 [Silurus meridionalis]
MSGTQSSNLKLCEVQSPERDSGMRQRVNTMMQSRDMKRQETGSGCFSGFLIWMLWFQILLSVTEAANIQMQQNGRDRKTGPSHYIRHFKSTVNLLTERGPGGKAVPLFENNTFIWMEPNESMFKLEDNGTSIVVPRKGIYFVNVKLNFYIPSVRNCSGLFILTNIKMYHSSYKEWINVIKNRDTMQCVDHWYQSVTLTKVAKFLKGTKLRVVINPDSYKFLIRDDSTYFSVTLL